MTEKLPEVFRNVPIAHRALHDKSDGRPENSLAAIRAAIEHGYGIEIDVQLSRDGRAMVFHDYALDRLTRHAGTVRTLTAETLANVQLAGGDEGIPSLDRALALVSGRVPLLIEIKDQDGQMGPDVGALEAAVAQELSGYRGPAAVMSFNPHSVFRMAGLLPDVPRGLVTSAFRAADWDLPDDVCARLREIPDFDPAGCSFISHDVADLDCPRVTELKSGGHTILCWTVRSPDGEAKARRVADNITFEHYLPQHRA